ncbi:hypothetical protein ABZ645_17380 [Nocardiopsis alba]|nr:hypothetical protein [Nocardiopsis alba]MEC3892658.1 hypothetical protein [Nocardiopsis sp. LDBS1602]
MATGAERAVDGGWTAGPAMTEPGQNSDRAVRPHPEGPTPRADFLGP